MLPGYKTGILSCLRVYKVFAYNEDEFMFFIVPAYIAKSELVSVTSFCVLFV